jgi:hypothetical protein
MSHGDAVSAADSMTDCTDLKAMMEKAMGSQMSSLPKKAKDCIDKTLTESALHEVFVQVFSGNSSSAGQVLVQPMTKCAQSAMQ